MPVGEKSAWSPERFISTEEICTRIQNLGILQTIHTDNALDGPAKRYAFAGAKGEIGFIGALSSHFCANCNRLRLTADGHLSGCLFSDEELDLKTPLRAGQSDAHILALMKSVIRNKLKDYGFVGQAPRKCAREMSSIGG